MLIRSMTTISAMTFAAAFTVSAQTPTQQTPQSRPATQQPTTQQPTTQQTQPQTDRQRQSGDTQGRTNSSDQTITVTGCLMAEKDVPGRSQSVTERAGVGEDYVLTNVKM